MLCYVVAQQGTMISPRSLQDSMLYAYLTSNVLQQKVTRSSAVRTPLSRLQPHICARREQGETGTCISVSEVLA